MASVNQFFKENRKARKNEFYAASKMFTDDKGEPLKWELRPLSPKKVAIIRNRSLNKNGTQNNEQFGLLLTAEAVVSPDLHNADLQDSYGVKKAEDLLYELLDLSEFYALQLEVLRMNGLDKSLEDLVAEAKN